MEQIISVNEAEGSLRSRGPVLSARTSGRSHIDGGCIQRRGSGADKMCTAGNRTPIHTPIHFRTSSAAKEPGSFMGASHRRPA
jgi:hypothetical protein